MRLAALAMHVPEMTSACEHDYCAHEHVTKKTLTQEKISTVLPALSGRMDAKEQQYSFPANSQNSACFTLVPACKAIQEFMHAFLFYKVTLAVHLSLL